MLSCLVYTDGKGDGKPPKDDGLAKAYTGMVEVAEQIATVMIECNVELVKDEYVAKFAPDMMEITMHWCKGGKFREICEMSDTIFEGTIIRCFRRLDELLSQLVECAKVIGNTELKEKFSASQENLKRGIVFTASLYL